jgi:putative membrane protein
MNKTHKTKKGDELNENKESKKKSLFLFLKGFVMGASDIIPGVSGGTMALITGIYEKLINSINKIKLSKPFKTLNYRFFILLGLGIVSAVFLMADLLHFALNQFRAQTYAFFFGLILASAIFIFKQHVKTVSTRNSLKILAIGLVGAIFAFLFVGLNPLSSTSSLIVLFLSAIIAISAMILPGISGSFILLLLGQYEYVLNLIKDIPGELIMIVQGKRGSLIDIVQGLNLLELSVFAGGAIIGLLLFSKIIGYLLEHRKNSTMVFLIGLMIGALRKPLEEISKADLRSVTIIFSVVFSGLIGFFLVFLLEKITEHDLASSE